MCLSKLDHSLKEKYKGQDFGWKIFIKLLDGKLLGSYRNSEIDFKGYKTNEWLKEEDFREVKDCSKIMLMSEMSTYNTGWHIYLDIRSAKEICCSGYECIKKVKFRNPTVYGTQGKRNVVVAKEMYIEE